VIKKKTIDDDDDDDELIIIITFIYSTIHNDLDNTLSLITLSSNHSHTHTLIITLNENL